MRRHAEEIDELNQQRQRITFSENVDQNRIDGILAAIARLESEQKALQATIPDGWEDARARFNELAKAEKMARLKYRQNADDSYAVVVMLREMISQSDELLALQGRIEPLLQAIEAQPADVALDAIEELEDEIDKLTETHRVTSRLSRARRALRGDSPDRAKAIEQVMQAAELLQSNIAWRDRADELASELREYDEAISTNIGMRMQKRLTPEQAESIASCLAVHRDVSLHF